MNSVKANHVFGPVPSRRLGRSLGVDIVPFKTCSYDCIYCQLGSTTNKTIQRKEWVSLDEVVAELKTKLSCRPDYITLSGSGEPTLFSRTGELIDRIKTLTNVPVAVLTNGSLMWQPDVRSQVMNADLIIPSLDAGDAGMFRVINRPHDSISFDEMLQGLIDLRYEYRGQYWLEVFLMAGHNAIPCDAEKLAACVSRIKPDRVQLNTVTRPPTEDYAVTVERKQLEKLATLFDPPAEVIADFRGIHQHGDFSAGRDGILELLKRRPCSLEDIACGLSMHRNEVIKYIEELTADNLIESTLTAGKCYYRSTGGIA